MEAERRANESQKAAYDAQNEIAQSNETLIDSSIERLTQESAILKREYAAAIASGDHQRAADINDAGLTAATTSRCSSRARRRSSGGQPSRRLPGADPGR